MTPKLITTWHLHHHNLLCCGRLLCSLALIFHSVSEKKKKKKNATSNSKQSHIQLWAEPVTNWAVWRRDPPLLLTSLSNSWIRVTFPVLESTRKYSAVPFSKVSPYLTGSPSGSVPFKTYTCVPEQDKDRKWMFFFFPSVSTNITIQKLLRWLARSSDATAMISLPHLCMSHLWIALSQRLKLKKNPPQLVTAPL